MNKLKSLVVVAGLVGVVGSSVGVVTNAVDKAYLTDHHCLTGVTHTAANCDIDTAKKLIKEDIKNHFTKIKQANKLIAKHTEKQREKWVRILTNTTKAFEGEELKEAKKVKVKAKKVMKEKDTVPKLLGGFYIMDGKCVRSGVYQPKPQPMENCKPAPKPMPKFPCEKELGSNCIF